MTIGIVGAMEQEVILLRNHLNYITCYKLGEVEVYVGQLYGFEVVLLKSGVGKVSAALGTTLLLDHFKPKCIINTGSAGCLVSSLKIGDIIVAHDVCYHDVDVTAFGYKIGQMVHCPLLFKSAPLLMELAKTVINRFGIQAAYGLVVSGDAFVSTINGLASIRRNFPQAIAVEMEAAAIAQVCHQFKVPFITIRAISDFANQKSSLSFKKYLSIAAQQSFNLVDKMIQQVCNFYK